MDAARRGLGLEPAGDVHRVAPQVERELPRADHPADGRPGMDADPQLQALAEHDVACRLLEHVEAQPDDSLRMVVARVVDPAHGHVGVADGLDLLHAAFGHELVEGGEELAQQVDDVVGAEAGGQGREADDVREEDRDRSVVVRDGQLTVPQPGRDRSAAACSG